MKDARWIQVELDRENESFASFRVTRVVLPPVTLVDGLPLATQIAESYVDGGSRFDEAVVRYVNGDLGLWFHAGWHDQAMLEVFDVKKGDGRLAEHMLKKLDDPQPEQNGDMIWGFASVAADWVLLLHVSRERRSFQATLRAATIAVADLICDRV